MGMYELVGISRDDEGIGQGFVFALDLDLDFSLLSVWFALIFCFISSFPICFQLFCSDYSVHL